MRFRFDLSRCAVNNSDSARMREARRFACLAWCLRELGHQVCVPSIFVNGSVRNSPRYQQEPFVSLDRGNLPGTVVCAEPGPGTVMIKTTTECVYDELWIARCEVFLTHEYAPSVEHHPHLLPVPFLVHDDMLDQFAQDGRIVPYLKNEVEAFRDQTTIPNLIGFIGNGSYGRREMISGIESGPFPTDVEYYDSPPTGPVGYIKRMNAFAAGILVPGAAQKSFRFSELAMLGIPIITKRHAWPRVEPPLTDENAILLNDWNDHQGLSKGMSRLPEIRAAADESYKTGWSPMGQAQLLLKKLGA